MNHRKPLLKTCQAKLFLRNLVNFYINFEALIITVEIIENITLFGILLVLVLLWRRHWHPLDLTI